MIEAVVVKIGSNDLFCLISTKLVVLDVYSHSLLDKG